MWARLSGGLFWIYFVVSMPLWWAGALVLWLIATPFDPRRALLHRYTCLWGAHYFYVCPLWRLRVTGREHIDALAGPAVLTANHLSLGDILVLFCIHRHFKWIAKRSVFSAPFLGWNMRMNDYVGVTRGNKDSIERMLRHCRKHLAQGSSLMIFPEGTRSPDGRLRPFKHGAFTLAVENDVPVVPVVIDGTQVALPKTDLVFRTRATITISILAPVYPQEAFGDPARLRTRVRELMIDELCRLRGASPDEVAVDDELAPLRMGARAPADLNGSSRIYA